MSADILPFRGLTGGPPRGGLTAGTPSLFVGRFLVLDPADGLLSRAQVYHKDLCHRVTRWKWVALELSPVVWARYHLSVTLSRGRAESIVLHAVLRIAGETLTRSFVEQEEGNSPFYHPVTALFTWLAHHLLRNEEDFGMAAGWQSPDARQCMLWAYLLWTRLRPQDNARARLLARQALRSSGAHDLLPRILGMIAQTYVEGIAYGWDEERLARLELQRYALNAWHADERDSIVLTAYSNFLCYDGAGHLALHRLERGLDDDDVCPLPLNFFCLQSSYRGDFATVERHLGRLLLDENGDRVHALGLQYFAQHKFFRGEYELGIIAGEAALRHNPHSAPAMRALAANLVACGQFDDARGYVREANREASVVFTTRNYAAQPWRERRGIERYAEALNRVGVPRS